MDKHSRQYDRIAGQPISDCSRDVTTVISPNDLRRSTLRVETVLDADPDNPEVCRLAGLAADCQRLRHVALALSGESENATRTVVERRFLRRCRSLLFPILTPQPLTNTRRLLSLLRE